jgi:signal transduction histidine kinase
MPRSLLDAKAASVDLPAIEKEYTLALEDFFNHREEKALYSVSKLGKELVLSRQGPDILLEMHSRALKVMVEKLDPVAISRMVINANEVLLSGIMAYAMHYYSYLDILENERQNLQRVKLELQAKAEMLVDVNQKLKEVDREREQTLMQQSRLAAMGEMLVNISHQWRQPLNVLGMLLQNLQVAADCDSLSKEGVQKAVSRGMQLIRHMSQTINDFSSYLRPEKAKTEFDVGEVVEKALSIVGETLQQVELKVERPPEPIVVTGFRNEYVQAIINILVNARDAIREREIAEPKITVTIGKEEGRSVVTIADNAGGIPEEIIGKIFDPYFTTKGPDKGTGIGLFMCKTLIERSMSGSLTVRNIPEGAEFRIEV